MLNIEEWAAKWSIPRAATDDLKKNMGVLPPITPSAKPTLSEASTQRAIRLAAMKHDVYLWRNNSGAVMREDGGMIRFGLGNDSSQVNAVMKSADLIGITPKVIAQCHVGSTFGVFTSIEVKRPGWKYLDTIQEKAQLNWAKLIIKNGGLAMFATCPEDLHKGGSRQ